MSYLTAAEMSIEEQKLVEDGYLMRSALFHCGDFLRTAWKDCEDLSLWVVAPSIVQNIHSNKMFLFRNINSSHIIVLDLKHKPSWDPKYKNPQSN